jgi:hypothetical protein
MRARLVWGLAGGGGGWWGLSLLSLDCWLATITTSLTKHHQKKVSLSFYSKTHSKMNFIISELFKLFELSEHNKREIERKKANIYLTRFSCGKDRNIYFDRKQQICILVQYVYIC